MVSILDVVGEKARKEHEREPTLDERADRIFPAVDITLEFAGYAWVIDQFAYEGTFLFSGQQGLGKTTCLVPLALAVAGIIRFAGITVSTPRNVLYVTEDVFQVNLILAALQEEHRFTQEDLDGSFHVRQSTSQSAYMIATEFAPFARTLEREILTPTGRDYTPPLTILDTLSAAVSMKSENDNSEAARNVALLREAFNDMLWMTGHTPKATRGKVAEDQTTRGASAFEANTQGTFYLGHVEGTHDRVLVAGKRRDQGTLKEILITSELKQHDVPNKYGFVEPLWYVLPRLEPGDPESRKALAVAQSRQVSTQRCIDDQNAVYAVVDALSPATKEDVLKATVTRSGKNTKGHNVISKDRARVAFEALVVQLKLAQAGPKQGANHTWETVDLG